MPRTAAHPAARLRDPRAGLRGRRDGHRQPQPAGGQRLQGLPRRRQPDRPARRQRDRRPDRRRRPARGPARAATPAASSARRSSTATSTPSRAWPRTARATCASSTPRCTASAARRSRRCWRPPASTRRTSSSSRSTPTPTSRPSSFPNPEEPGAMDLAMALAAEHTADLVVANDPDADRCAVAVPDAHGWRMLRGDEVGALLAHHLIGRGRTGHVRQLDRVLQPARQDGRGRRAAARGDADRLQVDRPRRGPRLRLRGGARLLLRPRAREGQGRRLRAAAGLRAGRARPRPTGAASPTSSTTSRVSTACTPPTSSRSASTTSPTSRRPWTGCAARPRPPSAASRSSGSRTCPRDRPQLPPTDGLRYSLAEGARVIVRPSGTEPKVKCYLEVVVPVGEERRRRERPDLRGRTAGRDQGRPAGRRRP